MRLTLYLFIVFFASKMYATAQSPQPLVISGRVVTHQKHPLPGSSIQLLASGTVAVADINGAFKITLKTSQDTLLVKHLGFETQKIAVNASTELPLIIRLDAATERLDKIVVSTGYQSIPKERVTGSFEQIGKALLNNRVSTDIISRLEGVSNVYFDRRTGGRKLSIRGRSTLFANADPLIVVDNFPYDGDINNINPNDVESITLLKDAAAASIWGVRAANGVIVITTKKGTYNKEPVLEFTGNLTVGQKPDLYYAPRMSPSDFIDMEMFLFEKGYYNSTINNRRKPIVSPVVELLDQARSGVISESAAMAEIEKLKGADALRDFDKYFYQPSYNQQYALNYSGGTNKFNYYLSAGWDNNSTYLKRDNEQRLTLRSENSFNPLKGLYVQAGVLYSQQNMRNNNPGIDGATPTAKALYPYAFLADPGGNALPIIKDYRLSYLDTAGHGSLLDWKYRPLDELRMANNLSKQTDTRFNAGIKYHLNRRLSGEIKYVHEIQSGTNKNIYAPDTYTARNLVNLFTQVDEGAIEYGIPMGGVLDLSRSKLMSQAIRGQVNYHNSWNGTHELALIGGTEIRQSHTTFDTYRTYGYNNSILTYGNVSYKDLLPTYDNLRGNRKTPNPADFSDRVLRFTSFYANGAYTFLDRYTASLSARKDASNLFGVNANQRGVPLWSAGLSWQINKEEFYRLGKLPVLKLRLTYGYNGNVKNNLSALTILDYRSNAYLTGLPYAAIVSPGNPGLKWEKSRVINMGMDFSTSNQALSGSIEYFTKKSTDLIGEAPVDPTTGVLSRSSGFSYTGNVADMKGRGIELTLNGHIRLGKWQWRPTLLFNHVVNEVTQYNTSTATSISYAGYGNLIQPFVGNAPYGIYGYEWAGLDPATGDPRGIIDGRVSKDYRAILSSEVGLLKYHGPAIPVTFGSFNNSISFKGFSLSVNIVYKLGYFFRRSSINYNYLFRFWRGHSDYALRWRKAGNEQFTNVPSLAYPNSSERDAFYNSSSVLVEPGDHIRLQDIRLSYRPGNRKNTAGFFNDLQFYFYANNLGILWKANKAGLDPDHYSSGFPLPPTFSFGCKASF